MDEVLIGCRFEGLSVCVAVDAAAVNWFFNRANCSLVRV